MKMKEPSSLSEYQQVALSKLQPALVDYIQKSAGTGKSLVANLDAFSQYQLFPRVLRGVQQVDTSVNILGKKLAATIMTAPTAFHKMFTPNGEKDTSDAAKSFGTNYIVSCFSTSDFPEIGKDLSHTWYQMLIYKDKSLMEKYIAKAQDAGCSAIVLTVDAPLGCSMCSSTAAPTRLKFPIHQLPLFPVDPKLSYSSLDEYYEKYIDPAASWGDIEEIIHSTRVPVIIKGILHPEDADKARQVHAKGIIVSNHGGRQLDNTISTLDALALIPRDIRKDGRMEIYMDGGIRSGTDVF